MKKNIFDQLLFSISIIEWPLFDHSHGSDVVVMPGRVVHSFTQGRTRIEEIKEQIFLETKWALSPKIFLKLHDAIALYSQDDNK